MFFVSNQGVSSMPPGEQPREISEKAWRLLVEARISAAVDGGQFTDLPGMGRPVEAIDREVAAELAKWRAQQPAPEQKEPT